MEASELVVGKAYFMCGYYFRNRPVPTIETWIYVGPENEDGEVLHRFQDPATYYATEWNDMVPEGEEAELPEMQQVRVREEDLGLVSTLRELEEFVTTLRSEPNAHTAF